MLQRGGWVTGNDLNDPYWGDLTCETSTQLHEPGEPTTLMTYLADREKERRIRRWEEESSR